MDKKIEIKEEDSHRDVVPQNDRESIHKVVSVKTRFDDMLLDADSDMTIKTEIKSETPFIKHPLNQSKTEMATSSNIFELDRKSEIDQQTLFSDLSLMNEGGFPTEHPVMMDKKYNSDHEIQNKIEIKAEPWWLETENSLVHDDIKDGDIPPVKSARLLSEAVSRTIIGKSPVTSIAVSEGGASFCNGIDPLEAASSLSMKQKSLHHKGKPLHVCNFCGQHFKYLTEWERHYLNHEGKKPHQCEVCQKCFTRLSDLKRHCLIHEGKKSHQCKTCHKSFTLLSNLKAHQLIHNSLKPHVCETCQKSFTRLSYLKSHCWIHERMKPHQCKTCHKSFTRLSSLKDHCLIHEGKKEHQCKTCQKSFTLLSNLKRHNVIHEGLKLYQCKTCYKGFTDSSSLKRHYSIHEGKKPHQCKTCHKCFNRLSDLKRHCLIHEHLKPHISETCHKSFTRLSYLKNQV